MAYAKKNSTFTKDGFVIETRVLDLTEAANKQLTLAFFPFDSSRVNLDIPGGTVQIKDTDFEILPPNILSWTGKALETLLEQNDTLILTYIKS